eukprot:06163_5
MLLWRFEEDSFQTSPCRGRIKMFITIFPQVSVIRAWYCKEQGWIINPSILIIDSSPQYSAYAPEDNHVQSQKSLIEPPLV